MCLLIDACYVNFISLGILIYLQFDVSLPAVTLR